ncbi:MAG: Uma2 family endonuclease [Kofleriaceae bacterium]|nr:Uma2 family endonuclease [Kofleriaceae bacterium]
MLDLDELAPERIRPIRRVEYDRMVEAGLFADERVELLRGMLVAMSPQYEPHAGTVMRLNDLLVRALSGRYWVRPQLPLAASDDSEPEPDLAIIPRDDATDDDREHPARALLVIEVADSSLRKDRQLKRRIYAEAEVPEYWVVDVNHDVVHVHRQVSAGDYLERVEVGRGAAIEPPHLPGLCVRVDEILPRPRPAGAG